MWVREHLFHIVGYPLATAVTYLWNNKSSLKRRLTMTMAEITAALGALKYVVPALEAAWTNLKAQLPQDEADIQAAVAAIEKALSDLKGGFVALEAAVKAAFSTPPAA